MFTLSITDSQTYVFSQESGLELETVTINSKGQAKYKCKYIANFLPEVSAHIKVGRNGKITSFAEVMLLFMDHSKSKPIQVPLKGLERIDWSSDIDLRCILNPDNAKSNEHIASLIRMLVRDAPVKKRTVLGRLGTHIIDGVPIFNAGDQLIVPRDLDNIPEVILEPSKYRLVTDPTCSEQEATAGMLRIIALSHEVGRILFSFNVLNLLREAFIQAGKEPHTSLFLYGRTGNKKTTIAGFQTLIHNRDRPLEALPRLNASIPAAVKLLYEKDDCVAVLDDLFPAQDRTLHKKQEATLLEITRVIGDGIEPARMRGYKVAQAPPRRGVLFTGEYCTGVGSDAARLLPIEMATPIDNNKLTACQNEPLILSTFYSYFLEWYITNFDSICGLLKERFAVYRGVKSDVHPRLQESQFCLEAAYKLFLQYQLEKGFISKEAMLDEYHSFYQQLREAVRAQNERVNRGMGGHAPCVDYLALIRSLYQSHRFRLVESAKDFEPKIHDGIIRGDLLYLRQEKLMLRLRTCEPAADFDDVLKNLKDRQALKPGNGSNSRKIGGSRLRFYAIKLSKLQ